MIVFFPVGYLVKKAGEQTVISDLQLLQYVLWANTFSEERPPRLSSQLTRLQSCY